MAENEYILKEQETAIPEDHEYGLDRGRMRAVVDAIDQHDEKKLLELLEPVHPADIADSINLMSYDKRASFVELLGDNFSPLILVELESGVRDEVIEMLGIERAARIIKQLSIEDAFDFIEDIDEEHRHAILPELPEKTRAAIEEALEYPDDSAGRLLQKNLVSVPEYWTVGQTIDYLRSKKKLPNDFHHVFLVDPQHRPVGSILVSRLIRKQRATVIKDIMDIDLKLIRPEMDQEEVAYIFRQYGLVSAPVVDEQGHLKGIISLEDVVSVIEEEAEEDIFLLGGVGQDDIHASLLETSRKRFLWLFVNFLTAILASYVISLFQGSIEKVVALAVLMPIIASMGGNAGTQTLTVVVRAIATKDITSANAMRVLFKEFMVGFINGILFALVSGVLVGLWFHNWTYSLVFGLAITLNLIFAGFSGVLIPISLVKLGLDPAIASGVFLTTVTDCVGFAGFLGFATYFLFHFNHF
ncbi:MAG: magnesium transporter [Alphaproteobacteria bacterium]|nr:magnesium transporter [Alphaproteobacteria bacterium]